MKQQNSQPGKRPPKPLHQAGPPLQQQPLTQQDLKRLARDTAKENSDTVNRLLTQDQKRAASKNRFKNRSICQQDTKRPPTTAQNNSKVPSPRSDLKFQHRLVQTMQSTVKVPTTHNVPHYQAHQSDEPADLMLATSQTQHQQSHEPHQTHSNPSKYQSTRQHHNQSTIEASITGRRVDQPKLIVQNQEKFEKYSPSRLANRAGTKGKKSKSQTIRATSSQNIKAQKGSKRNRLIDFLDTSVIPHNQNPDKDDEKDLTLKILNSSADNVQKYAKQRNQSGDRSKVQMKQLNYQKNVQNKRPSTGQGHQGKRSVTTMKAGGGTNTNLNKTQSTSADRIHRLTGSLSPRSKTGSHIMKLLDNHPGRDLTKKEMLTKSAVDIPAGISQILLDRRGIHNESDLSMALRKPHMNSVANGPPSDQSHLQLQPKKSSHENLGKKRKTSVSPDRVSKIDKIIRDNIRKEIQAQESKKREVKEREASSQRRKNLLELKNQSIRKLNNEKIQRRRMKLKENMTIFGEERDANETKLFEEALLAVSDGAHLIADSETKGFDSRLSTNKLNSNQGNNLRTQQLQQKTALQNRIRSVLQDLPSQQSQGRTQGMDFIDVRKEISQELRAVGTKKQNKKQLTTGSWMDQVMNLQTSKSQKQNFGQQPLRQHHTSLSLNHPQPLQNSIQPCNEKKVLNQIKTENMLGKREKIRKFMKDKQKLTHSKLEQQKTAELNSFKKVRCNLTKLNKYVQKSKQSGSLSGITTPHLKVKRANKKNITVVHDEHDNPHHSSVGGGQQNKKHYTALRQNHHDRHITPSRTGLFEQSDVSLNISAKRGHNNRSVFGQLTQKDFQKLHDTLYEDSRLSSIDTHNDDYRRGGNQNAAAKVLSVCFEKSASQKALRKSMRHSHSPQILRQRASASSKQRPNSALSLQLQTSKQQGKRKVKSAPKHRPKPSKRLGVHGQARVKAKSSQKPSQQSRSSINDDADDEADDREAMTLKFQMTDQAAAIVIQKEIRRYLGNLGFYEARLRGQVSPRLYSPDRPPSNEQINLYIKARTPRKSSKKSSPHRSSANSRKVKSKNSSAKSKRSRYSSDQYELIDPRSSQKSSIKLHISPQQMRNLMRDHQINEQQNHGPQLTLIASEGQISNSTVTPQGQKQSRSDEKRQPIHRQSHQTHDPNQSRVPPLVWGSGQISTPDQDQHNLREQPPADTQSQTSSLFNRNSFRQQFSQQNLQQMMKSNDFQKMINFREECVQVREQKETSLINKMLKENQMTPRTHQSRQKQIEKWVTLQKKEIEQIRSDFNEEWDKTLQIIEDTQKSVDQFKVKLGGADSNSFSQASSRQNNGKQSKSILIDEAPKSQRHGENESSYHIEAQSESQGILTSRSRQQLEELAQLQLGIKKQKSRSEKLDQNSKSEINEPKEPLPRPLNPQSMTVEKDKPTHQLVDSPNHHRSSSGGQNDLDFLTENKLSAAFINRLEKALLPRDSGEGTLNMEDAEEFLNGKGDNKDTFEDGNFKNQLMALKDLNSLFQQTELQGGNSSDQQSDHKSEPMMLDGPDQKGGDDLNEIKIQDLLKRENEKKDKPKSPPKEQQPEVVKPSEVVKPVKVPETKPEEKPQSDDTAVNNQMADKITEQIIQQIIGESFQLPKRPKDKSPPPMPEKDTSASSSQDYSIDKEEKKEWIEIRQRHLIEGNLIRADSYVNELVDVLLQFDISDLSENSEFDYDVKPQDNFHIQFLKRLTQPIQRPPNDTLELMQKSDLGSYQHFETTLDASKHPIVSVDLYKDLEAMRENSLVARRKTADAKTLKVWDSVHIYNKCIFDAVNESLMKFRPYGLVGQPMPWSNKIRRLQTKVEIASVDTERLFQMVKQEIFRWSQVLCGCMPGPVFYFPNMRTGKDEFQEDCFQEVRERRLTTILTSDTVEQEHHWLNYEFEEAQVKVDLSDMILETLVGELIDFFKDQ